MVEREPSHSEAEAGATEATMVSVSAATTAPNHFLAGEVFILGSSAGDGT
jgi:hypothetical protein